MRGRGNNGMEKWKGGIMEWENGMVE